MDCSFEGGIGRCSGSGSAAGPLVPKGPSGSSEPSTGSSLVVGTANFLAALGPLLVGVLGEEAADTEAVWDGVDAA